MKTNQPDRCVFFIVLLRWYSMLGTFNKDLMIWSVKAAGFCPFICIFSNCLPSCLKYCEMVSC